MLAGTVWLGAQPLVPPLDTFFAAGSLDDKTSRAAIDTLAPSWRDGYTPMIVDMARLLRPGATGPDDSGGAERCNSDAPSRADTGRRCWWRCAATRG